MTLRSIVAGQSPRVIIRANGDVTVQGMESDRVQASTNSRWGLKVERRSETEFARVRAKMGEHMLFDIHLDMKNPLKAGVRREVVEVQIGGDGEVRVPLGSNVKVYAGKSIEVRDLRGTVAVYAGREARIRNVRTLVHASAGHDMELECDTLAGDDVKLTAGRDIRLYVRDLTDARVMVNDLGGYWEGIIGKGKITIRLNAGGDVTLVTDQKVKARPPHYLLGKIEKPT